MKRSARATQQSIRASSPRLSALVPQAGCSSSVPSFLPPNLDRAIPTATREELAIGTKGHTVNGGCMPSQGAQCFSGSNVPQLDRLSNLDAGFFSGFVGGEVSPGPPCKMWQHAGLGPGGSCVDRGGLAGVDTSLS
jgi:hypothetical protein